MAAWDRLTSCQSSKIAEAFVASVLIAASGGRISPFSPVADDDGIDLIAYDKATGATLPLQVKSGLRPADGKRKTVAFDMCKATYRPERRSAVIAIMLDPLTLVMEGAWLIPMADIARVGVERPDKFALAPSRSETARDRYAPYRHASTMSLVEAVVRMLE